MKKDFRVQILCLLSLIIVEMSQSFASVLINDNNETDLGTEGAPFRVEPIDPQSEGYFGDNFSEPYRSTFPVEIEEVSFAKRGKANLYATLDLPVHKAFLKVAVGGAAGATSGGDKKRENFRHKKQLIMNYFISSPLINYYFSDMHD